MLLRSPLRCGFGPSTLGVNSPDAGSIAPTNLMSSSSKVALYSSTLQVAVTVSSFRSSGVFGFLSAPLLNAQASKAAYCFGNTTPPVRAMFQAGATRSESTLS